MTSTHIQIRRPVAPLLHQRLPGRVTRSGAGGQR
jgi:hypothetical protein